MKARSTWLFAGAVGCQFAAFVVKLLASSAPLFAKPRPDWSPGGVMVMALTSASAALLIWAAVEFSRGQSPSARSEWALPDRANRWLVGGMLAIAWGILVLFLISPSGFEHLADEDWWLENLSAAASFDAAVAFGLAAFCMRRQSSWPPVLFACGLAGAFLLVGLEEVSWFQRVFNYSTPEFLRGNWQGEANFHNLSSNKSEVLYYTVLSAFLILFPLAKDSGLIPARFGAIAELAPSRTVVAFGAMASTYNFVTWTLIPYQTLFFAGVFAVAFYEFRFGRSAGVPFGRAVIVSCVMTQALLLALPSHHLWLRTAAEYREFMMPLGGFVAGVETLYRVTSQLAPSAVSPRRSSLGQPATS